MSRFKQNWPGYYAVFISKDPGELSSSLGMGGGGGNFGGGWNLAEKD